MIQKDIVDEVLDWLNTRCWHDSVLYEIRLVRRNSADQAILILDMIQDYESNLSHLIELTFQDCWLVKSKRNRGIQCISDGEQIDSAISNKGGELVAEIKAKMPHLIANRLAEFHLLMASTGSTLDLIFGSIQAKEI